jgi:hypothetical protein
MNAIFKHQSIGMKYQNAANIIPKAGLAPQARAFPQGRNDGAEGR